MTGARTSPTSAGVLAIAPLGFMLLGSVLAPTLSTAAVGGGSTRAATHSGLTLTVLGVVGAACVAGFARWLPMPASRAALSGAGGLAAAGSIVVLGRLVAPVSPLVTLAAALGFVVYALLIWVLHGSAQADLADIIDRIPERDRIAVMSAPAEGAVWETTITSQRMPRLAIFGVLVFPAILWLSADITPGWWQVLVGAAGVLFCAAMVAWASVSVQVDQRGLRVRSKTLPLTLLRVRPQDVVGVASAQVEPLQWGGWGLRWSARHTAFIVEGGPGLVVHRRHGRPLALEVPSGTHTADRGAALLRQVAGAAHTDN